MLFAVQTDQECTLNLFRKFKLSIKKPLIPLKIILFCFYGAGSFITAFITVYFKQRGVTLAELSTTYMISPATQIGGTLLSGIIADKIGRSKPVLVFNLLLTVLILVSILLVPRPAYVDCNEEILRTECDSNSLDPNTTIPMCGENPLGTDICDEKCTKNLTSLCKAHCTLEWKYERNKSSEINNPCTENNLTLCRCDLFNNTFCFIECAAISNNKCYDEDQRRLLSRIAMLLYILWMTAFSNVYRIFDVTSMHLVTEYNADFGKQRVFSMIGSVVTSPVAGYLVNMTSFGGEKNYLTAFYFFISLVTFCILIVYKLDVRVKPPGQQMGKKATTLLKNPDVLAFAFVVLILGSSLNFTRKFLFWYLEELKAPSILIGLVPAVGALYGLPFLFTSEWWIKKVGTTQFLIISLLCYVVYGIGYSFLKNPWISLLMESLNIVTYHLLWVAVVLRSHEIAPEGLTATVISAAGSIHYQIGNTSGSLIARLVMNRFGGPAAFQVLAVMCFACAVLYTFYIYFRRKCTNKLQNFELEHPKVDHKFENKDGS